MLPSPVSLTVLSLRSRSRRLRITGLRYYSLLTTRRLERLRLTADDPGAAGEFVWSITISNVPANVTIEELTATLKVTAAGGQAANVTVTQAAGDSTIELDKETINLDVNGAQQTVNVTSNDSWTWAQAAARTVSRMMGR